MDEFENCPEIEAIRKRRTNKPLPTQKGPNGKEVCGGCRGEIVDTTPFLGKAGHKFCAKCKKPAITPLSSHSIRGSILDALHNT